MIILRHVLATLWGAKERRSRRLLIGQIEWGMFEAARHTQVIVQVIVPIVTVKGSGDELLD